MHVQTSVHQYTRRKYGNFLVSTLAAAIATVSAGVATAQEEIEEIVTTGSFITRPADRPQPVVIVGQDDIQANQRVSLGELMRDMPQVTSVNTNGTNGGVLRTATGSNSISIRGLGDRSTLILLNGQRQTLDGNAGSVVDINSLTPGIMVERVEMVLDGSSALYGSDAVAAVVNFVTRDTFEGAELVVSSQHAEAQFDAPEMFLSGIMGVQTDNAGMVMSMEWTKREKDLLQLDVYGAETLSYLGGTGSAYGNPGTFTGEDGVRRPDPLCASPLVGGDPSLGKTNPAGFLDGDRCRMLLSTYRTLEPRSERLTGMAVGTLEFDGDWLQRFRVETSFSRDERVRAFSTGSPASSLDVVGTVVPPTNPGVIDANQRDPANWPLQGYTVQYRSPFSPLEGPVEQGNKQFTYRIASTFDGSFGATSSWGWKLNSSYSQNNTESENPETIAQRFNLAVNGYGGPDCNFNAVVGAENDPNVEQGVGGCQYYNPFISRLLGNPGDPGYSDPEIVNWIRHQENEEGQAALWTAEAIITGDLFEMAGGTTGIALGGQQRRQTLIIDSDVIGADGGFASDPQPLRNWQAKRDTSALFAEMVMYPTDTLELDLAARWEETDDQGSTEPKISALYTPTDDLFIRASWGTSFRVPSEVASYGVQGEGGRGSLIIGGEFPQAEGYTVGTPDLKPETSTNWSVGVTWDATDSLTLGTTYWNYEFEDLVARTSANEFLETDIADGFLDDTVHHPLFAGAPNEVCEITGRWDPESGDPLPAGCATSLDIKSFNTFWINQDALETSGIDFDIDYTTEFNGFDLRTRLAGAYILDLKGVDVTTGQLRDGAGTDGYNLVGVSSSNRQLRGTLTQEARYGDHYLRLTGRYTDGYEIKSPNHNPLNSNASYTHWDLNYTYTLPFDNETTFTLAVINIGDKSPPYQSGSLVFNSGLFDARRRMFKAGLNFTF